MAKTDVQRPSPSFSSLQDFALEKVLDVNTTLKTCAILARTKCDNLQAIIIAEKCPFVADQLVSLLESAAPLDSVFQNDIYSQHLMHVGPPLDQGKFTIICPCTEKHVRKYCKQELYVIRETPEDYETITKPFIQKHQFDLKWVYNILEGKAEVDRVLYNDPDPETGFLILPDLKWDQKQVENLYLTGLARKGIWSVRELRRKHLPLLKKMACKGKEVIRERYGVLACQVRVYIHYQPTYYHLHVHFTHVCYESALGTTPERAHLLEDVIDNIEMEADYYSKCKLTFGAKEHELLTAEYRSKKPEYFQ